MNDPFPHILHGGDYNPDQWLHDPAVFEQDIALMHESGCRTFSVGIFAWSQYEPREGEYSFSWLEKILDRFAKEGLLAILATPSGSAPMWMRATYPEVRRVDENGQRQTIRQRHNHCWSSPVYREKVRALNTRLAERFANHPALHMWHVSNEFSGQCFCELCLEGFRDWLRARYGDLETLNRAWWSAFWSLTYTDWSEIDPRNSPLDGLVLDWKRFNQWQIRNFYRCEAEPLRAANPDIPVTTNLMGFMPGMDYHELGKEVDLVADDAYPMWDTDDAEGFERAFAGQALRNDFLRCLKGEPRAWMLMEACPLGRPVWNPFLKFKRPGIHHLQMMQALAHGANGTLYFQWRKGRGGAEKHHGAIVDHHHPRESRVFKDCTRLSHRYANLDAIRPAINRAQVAILFDREACWAYESSPGVYERQNPNWPLTVATEHYLPLWRKGITVDMLHPDHDFSAYKIVVLPALYLFRNGFADRLKAFVKAGGTVVATVFTGIVNETGLCFTDSFPGDGLEEVFGAWSGEWFAGNDPCQATLPDGRQVAMHDPIVEVTTTTATTLATFADGVFAGRPAATEHAFGDGFAVFLACRPSNVFLDELYARLCANHGIGALLEHIPIGVSIQVREADGDRFLFLLNYTPESKAIPLGDAGGTDLESGEGIEVVDLDPWQCRVVRQVASDVSPMMD